MRINTDMALVPLFRDVQAVENIAQRDIVQYDSQRNTLARFQGRGLKYRDMGNNYGSTGYKETGESSLGEHIDMYV